MAYFSMHNHSSYSNLKGLDAIIRLDELIQYANDIGLNAVCLSDHDCLSGHYKFLKAYKELKKKGKIRPDFRVALGNEIYLCMEDSLDELKEKMSKRETKMYHFLLVATNSEGHKQLRELSSLAWENMFSLYGMERVPTFKHNLKRIIKKGDVVGTTACAGSFIGQMIIKAHNAESQHEKDECKKHINDFITFCIDVFGKSHFFLELQPSNNPEQIIINQQLLVLSDEYGLEYTIATDGHYLTKADRGAHRTYLQSQNAEREVDAFYEATFIQSEEEVREYLSPYLSDDIIQKGFETTIKIMDMIEDYSLDRDTIVPTPDIPNYEFNHILQEGYEQYPYIKKFADSDYPIDRYYLHLVQEGLVEKIVKGRNADKEYFHKCLDRINTELKEVWNISEKMHERISSYYVLVAQIVDIMWTDGDSLVGVSRGSAAGYLTVFLLSITQLNPLDYDLPHFRHLTAERPELPDIDLDSEQRKRAKILEALKNRYGHDRVLNIATFSTEGSRSALLSAARGMQIDVDSVSYLTSMIPVSRGFTWSLKDCFFGNGKDRQPVKELINAVEQYDGLKQNALKIENLIKNRSVHASGIYIFNQAYTEQNAMMRAPSGQPITQFDMKDSDAQGALKVDALTVQALDRIRFAMDSLVEHGFIDFENTLRETYDKYLHPDVLVYDDKEMWKKVGNNEIPDLFQFDTSVGLQCAKKTKPTSVEELSAANSLMRLMAEDGMEQPMDKFVRHKENIQEWYKEMSDYNLSKEEVEVLKSHLLQVYGVGENQEILMLLSMDSKIADFTVLEANDLRRIVGKKIMEDIPRIRQLFFQKGISAGNSENILNYVWNTQVLPQLGYSFSSLHSTGYSLIALQEMNLAHNYPSILWATACLTVSANASEDEEFEMLEEDDSKKKNKATNYGKVASSIGKMRSHDISVSTPCINKSQLGFWADLEQNKILYGLKGIASMSTDAVHAIIANRPYSSFEDFHTRLYVPKLIQKKHMINLIKAGSFNSFDNPIEIMKQFVAKEVDVKDKLNMQNIKSVVRLGLFDTPELSIYKEIMAFREHVNKLKPIRTIDKPKDTIVLLDQYSYEFYQKHFPTQSSVVGYSNGTEISTKAFKKEYDDKMQYIKDLLSDAEFVRQFNIAQFFELWDTIADGTIPKWEMESVSFYSNEHELDGIDKDKYGIVNYFDLSPEPIITGYNKYQGRETPKYKLFTIMGTVLSSDKNKHTVTVLTPEGVVTCKTYSGVFAHYNKTISRTINGKKETLEKSWFSRGNLVMLKGFRREDQFVLRTYAEKGQQKEHTVNLIKGIEEDGSLLLQSDRIKI